MSDAEDLPRADEPPAPPASPRDRLLAALFAQARAPGEELVLLAHGTAASIVLWNPRGAIIHLLAVEEGAPPERLKAALEALVKRNNQPGIEAHFVVAGGGAAARDAVKEAIPRLQSGALGFFAVSPSGAVEKLGRASLPLLEGAAIAALDTPPLTGEAVAAALAAGQVFIQRQQDIAGKLQGSYRVTAAITAVCAVMLGLSYLFREGHWNLVLYRMGANNGDAVRAGQVYRLLSSAFLHGDPIHLLLNMYALWGFGTLLEALLGPRRYLVLYAASALGGSLASALFGSYSVSVGASGAIWGLMAGGIALVVRPRGLLPAPMVAQMRGRVIAPLAVNAMYSFRPGIDFLAHLGGGVVGFLLVAFVLTSGIKPVEARRTPDDIEISGQGWSLGGAVVSLAAMGLSIVMALAAGRPWHHAGPPELTRTSVGTTGVVLDLPRELAGKGATEKIDTLVLHTFGNLPDVPVAFEVIVIDLPGEVPAGEIDALLEEERKEVEKAAPAGFTRKGPARRITAGSRPAVIVEYEKEGLHLEGYIVIARDREVLLRGYSLKDRPASWRGIEEKVAASIARD
ncbi:MAG: rhomboid family intramembrane serine protease [Byssovorax sp.]